MSEFARTIIQSFHEFVVSNYSPDGHQWHAPEPKQLYCIFFRVSVERDFIRLLHVCYRLDIDM